MQDVEMPLVDKRRGHLGAAFRMRPSDAVIGGFAFFERDIASGAGFDGVEAAAATTAEAASAAGATPAARLATALSAARLASAGAARLVSASGASRTAGHSTAAPAQARLRAHVQPFTVPDRR